MPALARRLDPQRKPYPAVRLDADAHLPGLSPASLQDVLLIEILEEEGGPHRVVQGVEQEAPPGPGVAVHDGRPINRPADPRPAAGRHDHPLPAAFRFLVRVVETGRGGWLFGAPSRGDARHECRAHMMEEAGAVRNGGFQHPRKPVEVDRLHVGPFPFGERGIGGAVHDPVRLAKDLAEQGRRHPEAGPGDVALDDPKLPPPVRGEAEPVQERAYAVPGRPCFKGSGQETYPVPFLQQGHGEVAAEEPGAPREEEPGGTLPPASSILSLPDRIRPVEEILFPRAALGEDILQERHALRRGRQAVQPRGDRCPSHRRSSAARRDRYGPGSSHIRGSRASRNPSASGSRNRGPAGGLPRSGRISAMMRSMTSTLSSGT